MTDHAWALETDSVLDAVVERLNNHSRRVLIAAPFIGRAVGEMLAERAALRALRLSQPPDLRVLTAFRMSTVERGMLSAAALLRLLDGGFSLASIPNLHAKVIVIDDWALVGSGNLSQSGLDRLNLELGLSARGPLAGAIESQFDRWWRHALSGGGSLERRQLVRAARREGLVAPAGGGDDRDAVGTPLRDPKSRWLAERLRDASRSRAVTSLTAELTSAASPAASDARRMDATQAYRNVAALWFDSDDDRDRHAIRALLLDVLQRHPDDNARAHAAWRLLHDGWDGRNPTQRVVEAVARARRRDPAFVVRRNAARALGARPSVSAPAPVRVRGSRRSPRGARAWTHFWNAGQRAMQSAGTILQYTATDATAAAQIRAGDAVYVVGWQGNQLLLVGRLIARAAPDDAERAAHTMEQARRRLGTVRYRAAYYLLPQSQGATAVFPHRTVPATAYSELRLDGHTYTPKRHAMSFVGVHEITGGANAVERLATS